MIPASVRVAVIGGGPAGLMAAQILAQGGVRVDVHDAMPSVGRKFLLAGKGGLNLTHSEPREAFLARYGDRRAHLEPLLDRFGPAELRQWARDLGIDTFVGSSGRVFPTAMKAAPLLRAWLQRLRAAGVTLHVRHRWLGWSADGTPRLATPAGERAVQADALVLALGGGSWARLGSDGAWVPMLRARGIDVAPLRPANCGFDVGADDGVGWSEHFRVRYAGQPLKTVLLAWTDVNGERQRRQGEFVITATGVEGSLIYAASAALRKRIADQGSAVIHLDLAPDKPLARVTAELAHPRGARSLSSHLKSRVGIAGVKAGLLQEWLRRARPVPDAADPAALAGAIKALPLTLIAPRPLDEAISSAGGVPFAALDANLMLRALPGVFCAGEMLDWEAPTGGYLLTACFASGHAAGAGVLRWLAARGG